MDIYIEAEEKYAYLYTPYNAEFVKEIKRIGGAKWSSRKAWRIPIDCIEEARAIIKEVYGYNDQESAKMLKVRVVIDGDYCIRNGRGPITMFGKTIASAFGRDSGAKIGDEVSFIEGMPDSGGSMKNWKTVINGPAVFTVRNVPETKYLEEKDVWEESDEDGKGIHLIALEADNNVKTDKVFRNSGAGVEPYHMTELDKKYASLVFRTDAKTEEEAREIARVLIFECVVVLNEDGVSVYRIE